MTLYALLTNLEVVALGLVGCFFLGFYLGMFLMQKRVERLGRCFEHLVRHQCSESKADYIVDNARLMFSRWGQ